MMHVFLAAMLASVFLLVSIEDASAELISGIIGLTALISSIGVSTAVAGAIGGTLIGIGVSTALSYAASMLSAKAADNSGPSFQTPTGVQTSLTIGASVPRNCLIGPQATAGQLAYWNLYGTNNRFLQLVFTIGIGPHDSLTGIIVNGKRCTFDGTPDADGTGVTEFNQDGTTHLIVRFFNGFYDQTADAELVANANPPGRWTSDYRGRGVCYVSITLDYLHPELFPQGIPQFLFEVQGLRLYDRRKDSTSGGSGLHRWTDQHTWEYSDNPALGLYLFERGLFIDVNKQLGRGLVPVDLISDFFVSAANICDELVALKVGGTEKRYRIGMNVGVDRDWSSVEHDFCTAMAGWLMESAGAYGPIAGAAQSVAFTFTDDDLLTGREVTYSQKRSRSELINAIYGSYPDPTQNWQTIPYPARASSADEAIDGAEFAAQRDYPMLPFATQVQRIGEIERKLGRHQSTAGVTLGFQRSNVEQGDWVTWVSARRDFTKTFLVNRVLVEDDDSTTMALREMHADVFDFDEDVDTLDPLNPGDLPGINELVTVVPDFTIVAMQISGANGLVVPALHALWSPITDKTVDEVRVEYRVEGTTDAKVSSAFVPLNGEGIISDIIQAATDYEARAGIKTTPIREVFWTAWLPVTAPPLHVVPFAKSIGPGAMDLDSFNAALKARVTTEFKAAQDKIAAALKILSSVVVERDLTSYQDKHEVRSELKSTTDAISATVATVQTVATSTEEALAEYRIIAAVTFATPNSVATAKSEAIATAFANTDGAIASYDVTVTAQFDDLSASVSENSTAIATASGDLAAMWRLDVNAGDKVAGMKLGAGGGTTFLDVEVDVMRIGSSGETGGTFVPVYQISTVDGAAKIAFRGDMIADGNIEARMVTTGELITLSAQIADAVIKTAHIDTLQVRTLHIEDSSVTQPYTLESGGGISTSTVDWEDQESVAISVQAPSGTPVVVQALGSQILNGGTTARVIGTKITISGGSDLAEHQTGVGVGQSLPDTLIGFFSFTADGTVQSFTVKTEWITPSLAGNGVQSSNRRVMVTVFKK